jgi:hypothetical protein
MAPLLVQRRNPSQHAERAGMKIENRETRQPRERKTGFAHFACFAVNKPRTPRWNRTSHCGFAGRHLSCSANGM